MTKDPLVRAMLAIIGVTVLLLAGLLIGLALAWPAPESPQQPTIGGGNPSNHHWPA